MTEKMGKELYCCVDPRFASDVSGLLDRMRSAGYRVLVGNDPDELLLLLELSEPSALLYTLETEAPKFSPRFGVIERRALERGLPLIVVRPRKSDEDEPESALWVPAASARFEKSTVGFEALPGRLEALEASRPPTWDGEHPPDIGEEPVFKEHLRDFIRDGDSVLEVETRFVSQEPPRIRTTVAGRRGLVWQEDRPADPTDEDLGSKVEAQHMLAVAAYRPGSKKKTADVGGSYRGEISEPIALPDVSEQEDEMARERSFGPWLGALLGVGAAVALVVAMIAMIAPTLGCPKIVERTGAAVTAQSTKESPASGSTDRFPSESLIWPPRASDTAEDTAGVGSSNPTFP